MVLSPTQPMPHQASVVIGKITAVYGIKGWVKVHSYTSPPERLFDYQHWHLHGPSALDPGQTAGMPCEIADYRQHGKGFVARINGFDSREQAVLLCQKDIRVSAEQLPPLPEGEYYWQQLKGLRVFTRSADTTVLLGKVTDLFETGANDVIEVEPCDGSIDKRDRLIPYVPDIHVKNIDLAAGTITVEWDPDF